MKAFLLAVVAAVAIAGVAAWVLNTYYQQPLHAVFTTEGARPGDPGHNLIVR